MDESQDIEYKAIWKDENYKWICGFANANGGRIFLCVILTAASLALDAQRQRRKE